MRRRIVGLATALLVSGCSSLAGSALAAGPAQAQPGLAPQAFWCPGQPIPRGALWNMATCHTYHYVTGTDGTQTAVQGPPPACGPTPC